MYSVVVLNNKGGVGKTTSVVNIAGCLSQKGKKVLVVDLDPAASASVHLGFDKHEKDIPTLCDLIIKKSSSVKDYVQKTQFDNLFLVPSEPALSDFYDEMAIEGSETFFISRKSFSKEFDLVIFDSPPNMGSLGFNALSIADYVLIPVQTQFMALNGLELTLKAVSKVQRRLNSNLKVLGYFATQYDRRTNVSKNVLQLLQDRFGKELFKTAIGVNSKLVEAFELALISF